MHTNVDKNWIAMLRTVDMSEMNIIDMFVECCSDFRSSSESDDSYCSNYRFRNNTESDQLATGSCRPDIVLVPFSLFLGWALRSNRYLHPKELSWRSNCCNIDTERQ